MPRPFLPPGFHKWIDEAYQAAFLLDFDGTMVHFAKHPDEVHVPRELIDNLKKITRNTSLSFAIVTGRTLHALDRLMEGMTTTAIGSHGAEWRRYAGAPIDILAPGLPPSVRLAMSAVAIAHNCIFEDKIFTVSMHLQHEHVHTDLMPELRAAAGDRPDDYLIRRVGRTFEVLQKNVHKGFGIRHIMSQPGFAGKWPIYIGDDVGTDTSLDVVDEFKGIRLGVSNHAAHEQPHKDLMGIDSVNWIVRLLAQV